MRLSGVPLLCVFVPLMLNTVVMLMGPALLGVLLCPHPRVYQAYRRASTFWVSSFSALLGAALERYYGMATWVTGDAAPCLDRVVVISNHPTRLDWMLLWPYLAAGGGLGHLRIVAKAMQWTPYLGWAMQLAGYLFLARVWADDEAPMRE